jgi:hypothetical protein
MDQSGVGAKDFIRCSAFRQRRTSWLSQMPQGDSRNGPNSHLVYSDGNFTVRRNPNQRRWEQDFFFC